MSVDTEGIVPHPKPTGFTTQTTEGSFLYACAVPGCDRVLSDPSLVAIGETARDHRRQHVAADARQTVQRLESAGRPVPICPECRNGKHPNCDELAIDELTHCQCTCRTTNTERTA